MEQSSQSRAVFESNMMLLQHISDYWIFPQRDDIIFARTNTAVGSSRLLLSLVPGLELTRLVLTSRYSSRSRIGDVARSSVVFQPLLARTQISREERSGSKFSEGVCVQGSFHSDQG